MRARRLRPLLLLAAALPLAGWRCPGPVLPAVAAAALVERVGAWERFETRGQVWADYENPFDPAQVYLTGEFCAPDGTIVRMPGFATREYRRTLVGGAEELAPAGPLHWAVRFTPTEPGDWSWRWSVSTRNGVARTPWRPFEVDPPAAGRHGFLRPSPLDPRDLRFDDGTPYVAFGENTGWYDARGSFAYDDWFAQLAAQGANAARVWMPSWAFGLEWIVRAPDGTVASSSLGDYRARLGRAWQLDRVFEAAERHGIHLVLCIQNHGPFSLEANSEWADNPYNAANGGPLVEPTGIFTDPAARALFLRRLRYVVARWGSSPHLLAWELWNEVDLVASGPAVQTWHAETARWLHELDPYDHPITTSLARGDTAGLWALPEIELVQIHHYAYPLGIDIPTVLAGRLAAQRAAHPGKPQLVGEYGTDYRGPAETLALDPESIGFHHGLWAGLLGGGFGTGLSWWWDNLVDPEDLYFHFRPLAVLVDGIAFDAQGFAPVRPPASAPGRALAAYALRGTDVVLAWVQNVAHQWLLPPLPGPNPVPVEDATLALDGLADGAWTARWIDAYTGEDLAGEPVQISGGAVVLAVPTFARDVALRMERD